MVNSRAFLGKIWLFSHVSDDKNDDNSWLSFLIIVLFKADAAAYFPQYLAFLFRSSSRQGNNAECSWGEVGWTARGEGIIRAFQVCDRKEEER